VQYHRYAPAHRRSHRPRPKLGEPLLQLLAVVVGGDLLDLRLDLPDAAINVLFLVGAAHRHSLAAALARCVKAARRSPTKIGFALSYARNGRLLLAPAALPF
jgi:hypothetical protein